MHIVSNNFGSRIIHVSSQRPTRPFVRKYDHDNFTRLLQVSGLQRTVLIITIYATLLFGGWFAGDWILQLIDVEFRQINEPMLNLAIIFTVAIYVLASALPFVPGAEIGFSLILLFGGRIAFVVYISMVAALIMAFLAGRFVPLTALAGAFKSLGLTQAYELTMHLAPLNSKQRLALLTENAPRRFVPHLLRHRYLALMLILNLPGNSIIGGGGGIGFIAGLSRLFSFPAYLAAVGLAAAPIPLFFFLTS